MQYRHIILYIVLLITAIVLMILDLYYQSVKNRIKKILFDDDFIIEFIKQIVYLEYRW